MFAQRVVMFVVLEDIIVVNQKIMAGRVHIVHAEHFHIVDNDVVAHGQLITLHLLKRHRFDWLKVLERTDVDSILLNTIVLVYVAKKIVAVIPTLVDDGGNRIQPKVIVRVSENPDGVLHPVAILRVQAVRGVGVSGEKAVDNDIVTEVKR